jgi:hypothetical protein
MPKFTNRSADAEFRHQLRPNAERLTFEISGPSLWIDGDTDELVNDMIVLGEAKQSRQKLDPVQRMKAEAMGLPVRWPSQTKAKRSGKRSGQR